MARLRLWGTQRRVRLRPGAEKLVERDVLQELPIPRSGDDDTFDVVDDAVAELGLRRGVWISDAQMMINLVANVIEQAERFLRELVVSAMVDGDCGWADVAVLLGIDAEVARGRFDPTSPTADGRWMLDVA